jgi:hypothetical protein
MLSVCLVMLWHWLSVFFLHVVRLCVYRLLVHTIDKPYMEGISYKCLKVSAFEQSTPHKAMCPYGSGNTSPFAHEGATRSRRREQATMQLKTKLIET